MGIPVIPAPGWVPSVLYTEFQFSPLQMQKHPHSDYNSLTYRKRQIEIAVVRASKLSIMYQCLNIDSNQHKEDQIMVKMQRLEIHCQIVKRDRRPDRCHSVTSIGKELQAVIDLVATSVIQNFPISLFQIIKTALQIAKYWSFNLNFAIQTS